jgi:uncharacterized membrane protein YbhN (UPF0104 family)
MTRSEPLAEAASEAIDARARRAEDLARGDDTPGKRPAVGLILVKMLLVVGGLALLLHWALGSLPGDTTSLTLTGILLALLINQVSLYTAALRLRATLAAFDIPITSGQAFSIHLRSLFYFFFVPMSVGLEISRFIAIRRLVPSAASKPLIIALLLDRALGMAAALLSVVGLAFVVVPSTVWRTAPVGWGLAVLAAILVLAALPLAHRGLRARILALLRTILALAPRLVVPMLWSILTLALGGTMLYAFASSSGIGIGWLTMVFVLATSLLGMAVPISLLGAGLGEVVGVGTFAFLGITPAAAVLFASVIYCGRLVGAMQGALIELRMDARRITRQAPSSKAALREP